MADRYLLESGSPDGYLLEDGSGVYLLDFTPAASTLTDDFDDNSLDAAKWTTGQLKDPTAITTGFTISEVNNRVEITPPTTASLCYNGYLSQSTYDFTNSSVFVKLSNATGLAGTQECYLSVGPSSSNHYGWVLSGGAVYIQQVKAGVITNPSSFNYGTANPAWIRLRYDGTTVYVDTALAGASNPPVSGDWTNQLSMAQDGAIALTSCLIGFGSGTWASTGSPVTVQFDGLNTATAGTGTQTLTPSLFTNPQTFFAPTVTRGAVTLTPSLFTNSQSFFTPTVAASYPLTPALFTNTQTFYGPSVSAGAVTLTPSLFTNSQTFFAPTVTRGAVTLTPSLFTNSQSFFAPSVSAGAVTLTPSLVTNSQTFFSPVVSQGAITLAPSLVTNAQTFFAPTVTRGAVTLSPSLVTNTSTFYSPTVSQSGGATQTLTPSLVTNGQTFYSGVVTASAGIAPSLLSNVSQFFGPTVQPGAVTIAPLLVVSAGQIFAPSIAASNDVWPPLVQSATQVFAPTVTNIDLVISPVPEGRTVSVGRVRSVLTISAGHSAVSVPARQNYSVQPRQRTVSARGARWRG